MKNIIIRSPSCCVALRALSPYVRWRNARCYAWYGITDGLAKGVPRGVVGMQNQSAVYFLPFFYSFQLFATRLTLFLHHRRHLLLLFLAQAPCPSLLHNAAGYIEYFAVVK